MGFALRRFAVFGLVTLVVSWLVAGCGGNPPAPEAPRLPLAITITAEAGLNPDLNGRPSPVTVAILQLKSAEAFAKADYFAIFDPANITLAAEIIGRETLTLQPGEQRTLKLQALPEARFLGVAAAYRDIERATWLAVAPLGEVAAGDKAGSVKISLSASAVSATVN